ncbi:MAG: 16S rRNA (guanine(966)-N(2))-methyltransferase RsmD [Anaerolineae bacterium]
MSTRVIAGTAKGQRLQLVPGDNTRPITDKVKESLFNIINQNIIDATLLDLFAGTGAVGIEALSRGARHVLFNEYNRLAIQTIHENLKHTRLQERATVQMSDALKVIEQAPSQIFDYIYVAPPQYKGIWLDVLRALDDQSTWLSPKTIVIVQIDPKEHEDVLFRNLRDYDQRRYGNTLLWFFESLTEDS